MNDFRSSSGVPELVAAIDTLAEAGGFDRERIAGGLTRLVERQAKFQSLRSRYDPRLTKAVDRTDESLSSSPGE